jgi:hypothetical protein
MAALSVFGMLQVPERAAKLFDFVLVGIFLTLGKFEGFEDIFHVIKRFAQCFYDPVHVLDSTLNGSGRCGMCWSRSGWLWSRCRLWFRLRLNIGRLLFLGGLLGSFLRSRGRRFLAFWWWRKLWPPATTSTAASTATGTPASSGPRWRA